MYVHKLYICIYLIAGDDIYRFEKPLTKKWDYPGISIYIYVCMYARTYMMYVYVYKSLHT